MEETNNKQNFVNEDGTKTLSIFDVLHYLKRNLIWVIGITCLITAMALIYSVFLTTPTYKSQASLLVNTEKFSIKSDGTKDYTGSLRATNTISKFLVEDLVLKTTIKELDKEGQLSISQLKSCIETENSTTDIFIYVSLETTDPESAQLYLDTLIKVSLELSKNFDELENSFRLVSEPSLGRKSSMNKVVTIFIGFVLGAVFGVAFAIIKGMFASQFLTTKDVERVLGYRTIGAIFDDEVYVDADSHGKLPISQLNRNNYENLINNINFSNVDNQLKVIAFTSTLQGEGKSSIVYNLSNVFAETGKKVLVIDLDLRKSKVHRYFGIPRGKGVTDFVTGQAGQDEIIVNITKNLDVITTGGKTPNPNLILQTNKLGVLIEQLKNEYDYIFVDTPPVFMSDTKLVAKYIDAFVYIVSAFSTKTYVAKDAFNDLRNTHTNILGTVVTKLKINRKHYDNYYYYYNEEKSEE